MRMRWSRQKWRQTCMCLHFQPCPRCWLLPSPRPHRVAYPPPCYRRRGWLHVQQQRQRRQRCAARRAGQRHADGLQRRGCAHAARLLQPHHRLRQHGEGSAWWGCCALPREHIRWETQTNAGGASTLDPCAWLSSMPCGMSLCSGLSLCKHVTSSLQVMTSLNMTTWNA